MKRLKRLELKNCAVYNKLRQELETSSELDTIAYIENFSNSKCGVEKCFKVLSNLRKFDIPEKMIDSKKQTVTESPGIANNFNKVFRFNFRRVRQPFQIFHR